jgi:hypothetical protein
MSLSKFDLKSPAKPSRYTEILRQARVVSDSGGSLTTLDPLVRECADILTEGRAKLERELMQFFQPVSNDNKNTFHMPV